MTRYYDSKQCSVDVADDDRLGFGGRGCVKPATLFDGRVVAAKLIAAPYASKTLLDKVLYLRDLPVEPGLHAALPLDAIFDKNGIFSGYIMPLIEGVPLTVLERSQPDLGLTLSIARQVFALTASLHRHYIVTGDVQLANYVLDEWGTVWAVDMDSVTIYDQAHQKVYPTLETLEQSPETVVGPLKSTMLTPASDAYLAAMLVFQLLFHAHPLDDDNPDQDVEAVRCERVIRGEFPYLWRQGVLPLNFYGEDLAALFRRTFTRAGIAPSCADYLAAFRKLINAGYVVCPQCGSHIPMVSQCGCPSCAAVGRAAKLRIIKAAS